MPFSVIKQLLNRNRATTVGARRTAVGVTDENMNPSAKQAMAGKETLVGKSATMHLPVKQTTSIMTRKRAALGEKTNVVSHEVTTCSFNTLDTVERMNINVIKFRTISDI